MNNSEKAKYIIESNNYLSLSTCNNNIPWIAPVAYIYDDEYNFYFVSPVESLHSKYIKSNKEVAVSIFDSQQELGTGTGLQISGICEVLDEITYPKVVLNYINDLKQFPISLKSYSVYKITPKKFFIPSSESWEEKGIDTRIEVNMR